jgi:signal peptidase I
LTPPPSIGRCLVVLAVAVVPVAFARRRWLLVTVHGGSMAPTLQEGDRLLAHRASGIVPAGADIVIFRVRRRYEAAAQIDPSWRVKRVAAVAGDPTPHWLRDVIGRERIPGDHFAVQGDGPEAEDSRQLGCIHVADLVGIVSERRVRGTGDTRGRRLLRSVHGGAAGLRWLRGQRTQSMPGRRSLV